MKHDISVFISDVLKVYHTEKQNRRYFVVIALYLLKQPESTFTISATVLENC